MDSDAVALPVEVIGLSGPMRLWSILLKTELRGRVGEEIEFKYEHGERGSDYRACERHPCIFPLAVAFPFDREDMVGEAGADVAGRVDGIACGAAEGHSDHNHKKGNRKGPD